MKVFYRQKGVAEEILAKENKRLFQGHVIFGEGNGRSFIMQITSLELIRKFQTSCFQIPLLGEAETPIGSLSTLGLVKWLSKSDSTLACFFLLTTINSECSISLSSVSHSSQLSSLREWEWGALDFEVTWNRSVSGQGPDTCSWFLK